MFTVKSSGFSATVKVLTGATEALEIPNELYDILGELGVKQTHQRFDDQSDPDGVAWAELSPITIKRKKGRTDKLMHKLDLLKSIGFRTSKNGVFIFSDLPSDRVAPHQFGDKDRNIPRRAIFGLSAENEEETPDFVLTYLEGLF